MAGVLSKWARVSSACEGSARPCADVAGRIALYKTLVAVRDPAITVSEWAKTIDEALGLGSLAKELDAVPLRMRFDVGELGAMLASLTAGNVAAQPLADFTGIERNKV